MDAAARIGMRMEVARQVLAEPQEARPRLEGLLIGLAMALEDVAGVGRDVGGASAPGPVATPAAVAPQPEPAPRVEPPARGAPALAVRGPAPRPSRAVAEALLARRRTAPPAAPRPFDAGDRAQVEQLLAEGLDGRAIAEETGLPLGRVSEWAAAWRAAQAAPAAAP